MVNNKYFLLSASLAMLTASCAQEGLVGDGCQKSAECQGSLICRDGTCQEAGSLAQSNDADSKNNNGQKPGDNDAKSDDPNGHDNTDTDNGCPRDHFGADCEPCPNVDADGAVCSNHGDCLDGVSGDGSCVCFTGFSGKSCDQCAEGFDSSKGCTDCTKDHYGENCQNECPGTHDGIPCSGNGSCDNGVHGSGKCTCNPGLPESSDCSGCAGNKTNYPACDECIYGYYGENCQNECPGLGTSQGICSGKHGTCNQFGKCICEDGFDGDNCEDCKNGYFDLDCKPCSLCQHGASCISGISGHCQCNGNWAGTYCDTCKINFTGTDCAQCVSGRYGENCQNECPVSGGQVCSGHGTCLNTPNNSTGCACAPGWAGPDCSTCDSTHYGANCENECPVINGAVCGGHGFCNSGFSGTGCSCNAPYGGADCTECDSTHYGANCAKTCPTCANGGTCAHTTTNTIGCSCKSPWGGSNCTACDTTHYGANCSKTCSCTNGGSCENTTTNTQGCSGCNNHWSGASCSTCASPYYGANCNNTCIATNGSICSGRGSCSSGVSGTGCTCNGNWDPATQCRTCKAGYTGSNCTACAAGSWQVGSECVVCDMKKTRLGEDSPAIAKYQDPANETKCRFTDTINNETYQLVTINGVLWMRENIRSRKDNNKNDLKYDIKGYQQNNLFGYRYNYENAKKACPSGWKLPTYADINSLSYYAKTYALPLSCNNSNNCTAFKKLIAYSSSWGSPYTNKGYDSLGFSALPGGYSKCASTNVYPDNCSNVDLSQYGGGALFWNINGTASRFYNNSITPDFAIANTDLAITAIPVRCIKE